MNYQIIFVLNVECITDKDYPEPPQHFEDTLYNLSYE